MMSSNSSTMAVGYWSPGALRSWPASGKSRSQYSREVIRPSLATRKCPGGRSETPWKQVRETLALKVWKK